MKKVIFFLSLLMSFSAAHAGMECAGILSDKTVVTISVSTEGAYATVSGAQVSVRDAEGNQFGYLIEKDEIKQYYEKDLAASSTTFVGLKAFALKENPIDIFYSGPNYADQDLGEVLRASARVPTESGMMQLWRGPGYPQSEQFQVVDFVCGVWTDQ